MRTLYYDCFSGISGDMNLGALIHLGVDEDYFRREISKLPLKDYKIDIYKKEKMGIQGTKVDVLLQSNEEGEHHHNHRNLKDIIKIIGDSDLSDEVKEKSIKIFTALAESEGKIHGKPIDEIHFHEVGAVDSIIDIVGAVLCIDYLKVDKIISSSVELGGGFVKCEHGTFPVPAPAVMDILRDKPVKINGVKGEATTPTGASIIAFFVEKFKDTMDMKVQSIGYGIGNSDFEIPNVLRVIIGEEKYENSDNYYMIECNIDDMNPELYSYVMEKLLSEGAQDVYYTPIIMKKSRPATKISVLCEEDVLHKLEDILYRETTSLGLRIIKVQKSILNRKVITQNTSLGPVRFKMNYFEGKERYKVEFEDCKKIAAEHKLPLIEVIKIVNKEMDKRKENINE